jgi:tRNA (guanosine-2'-O-)-methyltransferase
MGTEKAGISEAAMTLADGHIIIPMVGMVQSLNVSVAAAVILFEAQRQRSQAGMYDQCRLTDEQYQQCLFEWCYPDIATKYQEEQKPYPPLDEEGQIIGSQRLKGK